MLVLGVIGLLGTLAYPNYTHLLVRARRLEAQTALLNLANVLEQEDAHTKNPKLLSIPWYKLSIQELKNKRYKLIAMPIGSQGAQDMQCQALTLTSEGVEGITTGPKGRPTGFVEQCWQ